MWQLLPSLDGFERAELLIELSNMASLRGSREEALTLAEEAGVEIQESGGSDSLLAMALLAKGNALAQLDRKFEAVAVMEEMIEVSRTLGDPFIDDHLRVQAEWFGDLGDWQASLDCQLEAIKVNEINGDQLWLARSFFFAACCYQNLEDFKVAITHYKKARTIYKLLRNMKEVGKCDIWISECYATLSDGEMALTYGNQAIDVSRSLKHIPWIVMSLLVLGKARALLGEFDKAESYLIEANSLSVSTEFLNWDVILEINGELAKIYRQRKQLSLADEIDIRITTIQEILE